MRFISMEVERMISKKVIWIPLLFFQLFTFAPIGFAAPPANQLNQYLTKIGWTNQQLMDYINYYEIPFDKIHSMEELQNVLGTPIDSQNYQSVLMKHGLSDQELQNLLKQFGHSKNQYKFVEDLNSSVDFFSRNNNQMAQIKKELGQIGVTSNEVKNLFTYLNGVEEDNKTQLDKIQALDVQLETFLSTVDLSNLTGPQINELAQLLTEVMGLYEVQVQFKMNNRNISLSDLLKLNQAPGNLYTAIYSKTGALLMDFVLPATFFEGMMNGWDQLLQLGQLSNQYVDYLHIQKYNHANAGMYK